MKNIFCARRSKRFILTFFSFLICGNATLFAPFTSGTLISTKNGSVPIEKLAHQLILTHQEQKPASIKAIVPRSTTNIVELSVNNEIIETVQEQQFYDPITKKWIAAKDLKEGSPLLDAAHNILYCSAVLLKEHDGLVHEISLTKPHTFFVGNQKILSHNSPTALAFLKGLLEIAKMGIEVARYVIPIIRANRGEITYTPNTPNSSGAQVIGNIASVIVPVVLASSAIKELTKKEENPAPPTVPAPEQHNSFAQNHTQYYRMTYKGVRYNVSDSGDQVCLIKADGKPGEIQSNYDLIIGQYTQAGFLNSELQEFMNAKRFATLEPYTPPHLLPATNTIPTSFSSSPFTSPEINPPAPAPVQPKPLGPAAQQQQAGVHLAKTIQKDVPSMTPAEYNAWQEDCNQHIAQLGVPAANRYRRHMERADNRYQEAHKKELPPKITEPELASQPSFLTQQISANTISITPPQNQVSFFEKIKTEVPLPVCQNAAVTQILVKENERTKRTAPQSAWKNDSVAHLLKNESEQDIITPEAFPPLNAEHKKKENEPSFLQPTHSSAWHSSSVAHLLKKESNDPADPAQCTNQIAPQIQKIVLPDIAFPLQNVMGKNKNHKKPKGTVPGKGSKTDNNNDPKENKPRYPKNNTPEGPNGKYEDAPYHLPNRDNGRKSRAPKDGQKALNNSVPYNEDSPNRVGISNDEFVVLSKTSDGIYHGHVRSWNQLGDEMKSALQKECLANSKGEIL